MAYHFNNRIEIIDFRDDPNAFFPDDPKIKVTIAKPWADIKTLRGDEFVTSSGLVANKNPIRFIIRYREGIKNHHKVKYQGKEYNIESIANDNGMNRTLTIFATTVQ